MGRIKTALVKRITKKLMNDRSSEFSTDFSQNKSVVSKYTDITSIKIRNTVAGYATRLVQFKKKNIGEQRKSQTKEDLSKFY